MTDFGTIKSYDRDRGSGTILPEQGGDALPFRKSDLQQQAQEPRQDQRYGYDVKNADNGKRYAINLKAQGDAQLQQEQARAQRG
jgi:cold shock protein